MNEQQKIRRQNAAIVLGAFAMMLVIAITIYRNDYEKKVSDKKSGNSAMEDLKYYPITGPELEKRIGTNAIQIVDIRSIVEFGLEHLPDSINIPSSKLAESNLLSSNKDIVLIGTSSEEEVKNAISLLNKRTDKKIMLLEGGFVDWKAIGGITVSWGDPSSFLDQSKTTFITIDELKNKIKSGEQFYLIDARRKIFFDEGHISGAINIPLADVEKRRDEIDVAKNLVVYADDELEAFQEAIKLFDMKLVATKVLKGGLDEWKKNNYVVEK